MLQFLNNIFLWFIAPAAVLAWLIGCKNNRFSGWHKHLLSIISAICIAAILAALSEPYAITKTTQNQTQVFLIDISRSISDTELTNIAQRLKKTFDAIPEKTKKLIICFADYPVELPAAQLKENQWNIAKLRQTKQGVFSQLPGDYYDNTNIQSAILIVQTMIKQNGTIYVFTDGLETNGNVESIIGQCAEQNINFKFETADSSQNNEVILSDILIPQQLRQGQNAAMKALLETSNDTPVQLEVYNLQTQKKEVFKYNIHKGINTISLPIDSSAPPMVAYEVTIYADMDTDKSNNTQRTVIPIVPKPLVYVLQTDAEQKTLQTIQSWLSETATVKALSDSKELNNADVLIVADADANTITPETTGLIRNAIGNGMGMIVFPGSQIVQDKLLLDTPLAELLPVKVHQYGRKSNPDTTVVFILDTSGSMTGARIATAREIARQAISRLSPYDKVGIVEFYGNRRWAAPIQSAANQVDIYRAINRLTPGGGTVIMPAMEEAYYALLNVSSTTKHVVVISDGGVEHADYEAILRKMADSRISVSTILVGPATHTGFMAELSQWGQGAFFNAEDRFVLPDINFKSVFDKAGSPFQQNTAPLTSKYPSGLISNASADTLPSELEYLASRPRTGSQIPLEFSNGQPLVAVWNYGTGKVAFCTADIFHQNSQQLSNSKAMSDIIANLCRRIYKPWNSKWSIHHLQKNDQIDIGISQNSGNSEQAELSQIAIHSENTDSIKLPVYYRDYQTYGAAVKDLSNGIYTIDALNESGQVIAQDWFGFNAVPEIKSCRPDKALIEKIQRIADTQQKNLSGSENVKITMLSLPCLILALVLFLTHIALRRLPIRSKIAAAILFGIIMMLGNSAFAATDANDTNNASIQTADVRQNNTNGKPVFADIAKTLDSQKANLPLLAVLCGDYASAEIEFNKKPSDSFLNSMLCGFNFYKLGKYAQAYEAFGSAEQFTKSEQDKKYALAWTMRMAEKSGKLGDMESRLLNAKPFAKYHCQILSLLYALNNNFDGIVQLREKIENLPGFDTADKTALEQEIINLSISSATKTQDLQKQFNRSDSAYLLGQVRKCLINGNRTQAGQLLDSMIADPNLSGQLLFIAQNASQMAFYDLADKAAAKAALTDTQQYTAGIFRVALAISRGQQAQAIKLLEQLQSGIQLDERQEYEIAQYCEKMGQYPTAIERYQQIYQHTGAMDVLMRVAWLCEKNKDFDKAYQTWLTLWQDCRQEALLRQIQPRLLEIASRTSRLAELAVQKEEALETSGFDIKTLELLVDLYVSVGDSFSAIELVRQYCGQSDTASLERQYGIYLRCREYGRCRRILQQLMITDPQNSNDYLRQLALLAVEKGNERDAMNVVKSIQNHQDANAVDLEYIAGIWDLLEQHEYAMQTYERLLKQGSHASETWLLWSAAAKEAGHKDTAVNALAELLVADTSDDLFAVAADALLNLDAGDIYLQKALTQIYTRIAQTPDKVFLYRLAIDVLSETSKSSDYSDFLFAASVYSADGRVAWIQEAQRGATQNQTDSLDYGMVLVYMNSKLPPSVCIELGKSFLELGQYETAWFLFHKSNFIFDNSSLSLEIANSYDSVGKFEQAALVIGEALAVTPDDLQLLVRSASYNEIDGNFPDAMNGYFKAYQLSLKDFSSQKNIDPNEKINPKNIRMDERCREIALNGILSTITTDAEKEEILLHLEKEIMETCKSSKQLLNKPRLLQLWKDYKQLSAAMDKTARMDNTLNLIAQQFPDFTDALNNTAAAKVTHSSIDEIMAKDRTQAERFMEELRKPKLQAKPAQTAQGKDLQADDLAETLSSSDANQRSVIIEQAVNSLPATQRRLFLLNLSGQIKCSLTQTERQIYTELFESQPPIKLPPKSQYITLTRYDNCCNESTVLLQSDIAEILLSDMPDNLYVNAFTAAARFKAGKKQQAYALAGDVIDNLTRTNEINHEFNAIINDMSHILPPDDIKNIIADLMLSQDVIGTSPQLCFIIAILYDAVGEPQQARTQMKQCFLRLPDNIAVVHNLIALYDTTGYKKELAELISDNINNAGLSASLQWRTLVRLYYQTGQYDLMAKASAKDTTPLRNFNYFIMYKDTNNVPELVHYFRKCQTDMRREGRFFSPLWLDWNELGGIKGYQQSLQTQASERLDVYHALAPLPELTEDYIRYWQAMTTDRSDFEKFADAYAYKLSLIGRSQKTISDIIQAAADSDLTQKDYTLLLSLVKYETRAGTPQNAEIIEKLENQTDSSDINAWRVVAEAYRISGQKEKTKQYYQWLSIHQIAEQPEVTPSEIIFDDMNKWLELDDSKNLDFLMPWLTADALMVNRLEYESAKTCFIAKWCDSNAYDSRIKAIEKIIANNEYNAAYNPLRFDLLRYYISTNNQDLFVTTFRQLLTLNESVIRNKYQIDYQKLASSVTPELIAKYFNLMQIETDALYQQCGVSSADVVKNLSLIAITLYENNNQTQAQTVLENIKHYLKEPSLISLWFSDALRICGYSEQADAIEQDLLNKGIMPKTRINRN